MSNPILSRIKAKSEEIGLEAAALYYSGDGPGKKISPAQLQKVMDDQEMPTPRMCLRVVEDLEIALGYAESKLKQAISNWEQSEAIASDAKELAFSNADLLARIRILESQAVARSGVVAQGFPIVAPIEPLMPARRQPWMPAEDVQAKAAYVQPWMDQNVARRASCGDGACE